MKSIICTKPFQFELTEVEKPSITKEEALIRIKCIGVCGTDLHAYQGNQPFFSYPRVLGHELSGTIDEIGENEGNLKIGDPVIVIPYVECGKCIACRNGKPNCCTKMNVLGVHSDGGMREYMNVPVTHIIKSEGLSWEEMALVECLTIGAHGVKRADIKTGEWVLVIGSGPIGLGAMQFAKVAGGRVIAMDVLDNRLEFCKKNIGVEETVNALKEPMEKLKEITGGDFPTVIIDATGNSKSMNSAVNYLAHGGRMAFIGLHKEDIVINDIEFHKRESTLLACRNSTREDFQHVINCLENGSVKPGCFITHRTSLDKMVSEFEAWTKPETGVIKAMIEVS